MPDGRLNIFKEQRYIPVPTGKELKCFVDIILNIYLPCGARQDVLLRVASKNLCKPRSLGGGGGGAVS